jgi:hypothetical protein
VPLNPIKEHRLNGYPSLKQQNGKFIRSENINPSNDGANAIATRTDLDGFVEVDTNLDVVDDFSEITSFFNSHKNQSSSGNSKQYGEYVSGGKKVGNKVYFLSNISTGHSTLYVFDKNSREVSPFEVDRTMQDVVFLGAGKNYLLIQNAATEQVYKADLDGKCTALDVPGVVISVSDSGEFISYEPYDNEGHLTRGVSIVDVNKNSTKSLFERDNKLSFNSSAYFSQDDKWLATILYNSDSQKPDQLLVVNLKTNEKMFKTIELKKDKFGNPLPVLDGADSIVFISGSQIELTFDQNRVEIINYK